MARRLILVLVGICLVVGVTAFAKQAQTRRPECALQGKGAFDLGSTQAAEGGSYRCVPTFDAALKMSGAAWTKVNADGTLGAALPK
jgi:hypothetical protein